ncbi:MAG: twin-arginine translocase subunit TatB [Rhodospirillales bacterium]|jgi:sec-independent protein translocase protein TatB|nr:twin-arginine translocase subunit TatB [Rhodospirillales bacterium]
MFNFSWSELAVIVAVALVLIGPKDMPAAVRAISGTIKKARRMASEFQGHVDEMMREANLGDVRDTLNEFRNLNVADALERTIDSDGSLRSSFTDDAPTAYGADAIAGTEAEAVGELSATDMPRPEDADPTAPAEVPAFVPPAYTRPEKNTAADTANADDGEAAADTRPMAPAFVPPGFVPPGFATPRLVRPAFTPAPDAVASDPPTGDTPTGDTPTGDTPAADTPSADTPVAEAPASDAPAADPPAPDAPAADASPAPTRRHGATLDAH